MEKEILDQITLKMGIISGFIFLAIIIPLRIYWRKEALKKIESELLDDEKILYKLEFSFINDYMVPYFVGAFWGSFILPFIAFKNIINIKFVTSNNLIFFIILELFAFAIVLFISSWIGIITNKRILRLSNFSTFNKLSKAIKLLENLNINEIESLKFENSFSTKLLKILTINKKSYSFGGYKNMDKIKLQIDELIKIGV